MKRRTYTEAQKTHAEYLYLLEDAKAVAEFLGLALSTVYRKFKEWDIRTKPRHVYCIRSGDPRMTVLLAYIKGYWKEHGFAPSVREIMNDLEISSTSVVVYRLELLEKYGQIKRTKNISRSIVVVGEDI